MLEQQLIDYIKKARQAGQTDEQTRALLYKNGWTAAEIDEAVVAIDKPQAQPQMQPQPEQEQKPTPIDSSSQEIKIQRQPQAVETPAQQQPQAQPKMQTEAMPSMKVKSHRVLKTFIVLIFIIALLGAGLYVAGQYFNLSWTSLNGLFQGTPDAVKVISSMNSAMGGVKSSHTETQMEISGADFGKISLNISGGNDMTDLNNHKSDLSFIVNLQPKAGTPYVLADANVISSGVISYLKINNILLPEGFSYPGLDVSKIKGVWIKIDQDSVNAISKIEAEQNSANNNAQNIQDLSKVMKNIVLTNGLFSDMKKMNDQIVSGQDTNHYSVKITSNGLRNLINKIIDVAPQNESSDMALAKSLVSSFIDTVGDINAEIWIGKTDSLLYKIAVDKAVNLSKIYPPAKTINIKFVAVNSNFNTPVTVQIPNENTESVQKLEEIMSPLIKASKIGADLGQIGTIAQSVVVANNSYSSLCYKSLLNGYLKDSGADLIALNNDIVSQGAKKPSCFSATDNYCVSTQLTDGSYLCIGKDNILGKTKCVSSGTICQ